MSLGGRGRGGRSVVATEGISILINELREGSVVTQQRYFNTN